MAQAKKKEKIIAEEVTADQAPEVRDEAEVKLPGEAASSVSVADVSETDAQEERVKEALNDDELDDESDPSAGTTKAGKRSAKALREAATEDARQAAKEDRAVEPDEPKAPKRQEPNPLHQHGKKYRAAKEQIDRTKLYGLEEALELAVKTASTKFDSSVEVHVNLGVDPRQADQMVRSTVVLPHGTGKTIRIAVFADGAQAEAAMAAGADIVGTDKLMADI